MSKICPKCGEPLKYKGYSSCGTEACKERCIRNDELAKAIVFLLKPEHRDCSPGYMAECLENKEHRK